MVFLGDKVLTEQYQSWPTLAQNGLRIAQYSKRIKTLSESQDLPDLVSIKLPAETALGPNSRIKLQQIDFAPIRELSSVSQTSLASVQFEYRSPIALDPTALSNTSDASVAVRFEDEQAWILESRIGKGRCLWISSSCDDGDSNLPTRSIYVPLMQKLTAYVCNAESPSTQLVAGDRWSRSLVGLASKTDYSANEFQIKKPDGKIVNLPVSSEGQLRFNDTRLLGTYLGKRVPVNASPFVNAQRTDTTTDQLLFCVRSKDWRSTKESNLDYLTADELAKLAISCKASVATNASGFLDSSETDWHGREVWTWIWIALLFLFLAEIALEQRLSPKIRAKTKLATFPVLSRTSK